MLEGLFSTFAEWSEIKVLLSLFVFVVPSATHCLRLSTLLSSKAHFFCLSSDIFVQVITYSCGMRSAPTSLHSKAIMHDTSYRMKHEKGQSIYGIWHKMSKF